MDLERSRQQGSGASSFAELDKLKKDNAELRLKVYYAYVLKHIFTIAQFEVFIFMASVTCQ